MNDLPVILSYFAQSQNSTYLSMLEEEQSTIQLAWENASNPIEVKYLPRPSGMSNRDQIIADIKKYGRRIVLFQFSGHAGPDAIQLSDGAGGPEGIAELLKNYATNLKLVVLNGCSTRGHVETLLEHKIRAIVATTGAINDTHATQFATTFHKTLCEGKAIQNAFNVAISVLKFKHSDQFRPHVLSKTVVTRSMLKTLPKAETNWDLFIQDNGEENIIDPKWWDVNEQAKTNQPPANFYEAGQYREFKRQLDDEDNAFAKTKAKAIKYPDDTDFQQDLIRIDERRNEIQKKIDGLKEAVLKLADDFSRISINTERLQKARVHFDAGEYEKARAILDTEKIEIKTELDALLDQKEKLTDQTAENHQKLQDKANEYLILAQLTATAFDLPDRFKKTKEYFELSLKADRNAENLSAYADFLSVNYQFREAYPLHLYEEALLLYRKLNETNPKLYSLRISSILNNLAHHYDTFGQDAQPLLNDSLYIIQQLAQTDPQAFLPDVAKTQNNLAQLYTNRRMFTKAKRLYKEAIETFKQVSNPNISTIGVADTLKNLATCYARQNELIESYSSFNLSRFFFQNAIKTYGHLSPPYSTACLPSVTDALNNLGLLYEKHKKFSKNENALPLYREALHIRRELAQVNPQIYLPLVATTLSNLAGWYRYRKLFAKAEFLLEESLIIRRQLAHANPELYLPDLIRSAFNMSLFYKRYKRNKSRSLDYAQEAIKADVSKSFPFMMSQSDITKNITNTLQIVEAWGEDPDAFLQRVKDSIKPTDE